MNGKFNFGRIHIDTGTAGERGMRTIKIITLFILISIIIKGCMRSAVYTNEGTHVVNTYIDDSLFQLNLPLTIVDRYYYNILTRGYILGSCGNSYTNSNSPNTCVSVSFECDFDGDSLTASMLDNIYKNQIENTLKSKEEVFISFDTIIRQKQKIGILKKVEGCGDSALYTTICYFPSPHKNKIYKIYISCDKSEAGKKLRDSIPSIVESLRFGSVR